MAEPTWEQPRARQDRQGAKALAHVAKPTWEQRRAQDAWNKSEGYEKEHANLAKGLPALIMNSGLLQTMAFLHEKGEPHCEVAQDIRRWLRQRFLDDNLPEEFEPFMVELMAADAEKFQAITTEALAWLRWLRQMATARAGG